MEYSYINLSPDEQNNACNELLIAIFQTIRNMYGAKGSTQRVVQYLTARIEQLVDDEDYENAQMHKDALQLMNDYLNGQKN